MWQLELIIFLWYTTQPTFTDTSNLDFVANIFIFSILNGVLRLDFWQLNAIQIVTCNSSSKCNRCPWWKQPEQLQSALRILFPEKFKWSGPSTSAAEAMLITSRYYRQSTDKISRKMPKIYRSYIIRSARKLFSHKLYSPLYALSVNFCYCSFIFNQFVSNN